MCGISWASASRAKTPIPREKSSCASALGASLLRKFRAKLCPGEQHRSDAASRASPYICRDVLGVDWRQPVHAAGARPLWQLLHHNVGVFPEVQGADWGKKLLVRLVGAGFLAFAIHFALGVAELARQAADLTGARLDAAHAALKSSPNPYVPGWKESQHLRSVAAIFMRYLRLKHYNHFVLADLILPGAAAKRLSALVVFSGALAAVALSTWLGWRLQLGLATTGSIYLVLVVVTAVYSGFWTATAISVVAVSCLNYFFVPPIFTFTVNSAEDKVALCVFEFTALVVSRLSDTANLRAAEANAERRDSERLYEAARRILLLDRSRDPGEVLTSLLREVFELDTVALFDAPAARTFSSGSGISRLEKRTREAHAGDKTVFDPETSTWYCVLHVDARPIRRAGALRPIAFTAARKRPGVAVRGCAGAVPVAGT